MVFGNLSFHPVVNEFKEIHFVWCSTTESGVAEPLLTSELTNKRGKDWSPFYWKDPVKKHRCTLN